MAPRPRPALGSLCERVPRWMQRPEVGQPKPGAELRPGLPRRCRAPGLGRLPLPSQPQQGAGWKWSSGDISRSHKRGSVAGSGLACCPRRQSCRGARCSGAASHVSRCCSGCMLCRLLLLGKQFFRRFSLFERHSAAERHLPSDGSRPRWLHQPGLGHADARGPELRLGLRAEAGRPVAAQARQQEAEQEAGLGARGWASGSVWRGSRLPSRGSTHCAKAPAACLTFSPASGRLPVVCPVVIRPVCVDQGLRGGSCGQSRTGDPACRPCWVLTSDLFSATWGSAGCTVAPR